MSQLDKFFDVTVLFSPLILVSSFVIMSIVNHDLKAFVLVLCLLFADFLGQNLIATNLPEQSEDYLSFCTMFNVFSYPSSSLIIISFIIIYLLAPMMINGNYNPLLLTCLATIYSLEVGYKYTRYKCYSLADITISTLLGFVFGALCFFAIYSLGETYYNLLYFNVSQSNRVQCNRANNVTYECTNM